MSRGHSLGLWPTPTRRSLPQRSSWCATADDGLETLLIRRNTALEFAGGMWVFPGGRIDPDDYPADAPHDEETRRPPGRGARSGRGGGARARRGQPGGVLALDGAAVVAEAVCHLVLPGSVPARHAGHHHRRRRDPRPCVDAAGRRHRPPRCGRDRARPADVDHAPPLGAVWPTWPPRSSTSAPRAAERFETRFAPIDGGLVAVYAGDVAYETGTLDDPGPRHRLWMIGSGWRYERD